MPTGSNDGPACTARDSPPVSCVRLTPVQRYTHFFYTLEPKPPFAVLAVSKEFCLGSAQDATDCESVQFVSGLAVARADSRAEGSAASSNRTLILTYGVNDCEARIGTMALKRVHAMLRPLEVGGSRCA